MPKQAIVAETQSSDDDEEYEVEFILASRLTPSGRKYLVKWKNWPDDQNSWEPAENINAKEHIEQYEQLRRAWTQRMPQNSKFYPA